MPRDFEGSAHDELLKQFEETIAGLEPHELRALLGELMARGRDEAQARVASSERLSRRTTPREQPASYVVRVDLDDAKPPIWRRLELRSDLPLDRVHDAIQAVMGWTDTHLHRFSLGAPFDPDAEQFLCPFDVEEGDDSGVPEHGVRLDETLAEPGDVLRYLYDYGDHWGHTLRLEQVTPLDEQQPWARCVDGRRACPPEDCGSLRSADALTGVLDDPSLFDLDDANQRLTHPFHTLVDLGVAPPVVALVTELRGTVVGTELVSRLFGAALTRRDALALDEKDAALHAITWMLDHVGDDGLQLTGAGYLKPADVEAVAAVIPSAAGWIGRLNREVQTAPVLGFRQSLMHVGLLRRRAGRLVLTAAGRRCREDADRLWTHLVERLVPPLREDFSTHALLVWLALTASWDHASATPVTAQKVLLALGWDLEPGFAGEIQAGRAARDRAAFLYDIVSGPRRTSGRPLELSPAALALVREAILGPTVKE